jgi:hypothetical protein
MNGKISEDQTTLSVIRALSAAGSMIGFDYASLSVDALNQLEIKQLPER